MLEAALLSIKRKNLMRKFKSFEVKYRAKYLGEAMARAESEASLAGDRARLQDAIQDICAKKDIGHEEMNLVEDELNDFVNRLVREAFEAESKKIQKRELVDGRIKIKRVDRDGLNGNMPVRAPEPEL